MKRVTKKVTPKFIHAAAIKGRKEKANFNIKMTPTELKELRAVADKYMGGNLTALVKYAAKNFKPLKSDMVRCA